MLTHILVAAGADTLSPECRLFLEARGHRLHCYPDFAPAIGAFFEEPPDAIVIEHGFAGGRDGEFIRTAQSSVQKTNIPIILLLQGGGLAGLDFHDYPVDDFLVRPFAPEDLAGRLALAEARMLRVFDNNPLSRLPGNTSIIRAIGRTLAAPQEYAVCYVDIDNFKPYNDRYGFTQGDDVILMVARIIVNVVSETARDDSFVGHIGGDDFVYIVPLTVAEETCRRVLAHFERVKTMFIDPADLAAGGFNGTDRQGRETRFPLLSLSIAVVRCGGDSGFRHYGEVAAAASQVKHHVKQREGSNFLIDRRSPAPIPPDDDSPADSPGN